MRRTCPVFYRAKPRAPCCAREALFSAAIDSSVGKLLILCRRSYATVDVWSNLNRRASHVPCYCVCLGPIGGARCIHSAGYPPGTVPGGDAEAAGQSHVQGIFVARHHVEGAELYIFFACGTM